MAGCELTEEQIMKIAPDADEGCFVECTLDYPQALHDLHADYPLAPRQDQDYVRYVVSLCPVSL